MGLGMSINCQYCTLLKKRGNFAQNAKFWHFSSYHHFKALRASDFILGYGHIRLSASQIPCLNLQKWWPSSWRYITANFRSWVVCALAMPTPEMSGAWNS